MTDWKGSGTPATGFTYNADLSADRDKLRRAIGDVTDGSGVLPSGDNFTDNELDSFMDEEGTWQKAVAYACESLGNAWATSVSFSADGTRIDRSDVAQAWREQAKQWRAKYGGSSRGGIAAVKRADGFSTDLSNIEA